jgi:uncharacterized protein
MGLLLGAGAVAGAVGSAGGITSLISYPALLAVGIRPLAANVTNTFALVGILPGAAIGSRPELRGQFARLKRWAPLVTAGTAAGVALLLLTPNHVFARIVPYLLAFAAIGLLAQPWVSRWREANRERAGHVVLPLGLLAISVYSGYFGAGSGVMALALLLLTVEDRLPIANAIKNILLGFADVVAAVAFAFFGPVHWGAAVPLLLGLAAGSVVGPAITRRVPPALLRVVVAATGLGLAAWLWANP